MTKRKQLIDVMSAGNVLALDDIAEDSEPGNGNELDIHSGAGIGLRMVCCTRLLPPVCLGKGRVPSRRHFKGMS